MSIKQCIQLLPKPNLMSKKCSALSSILFGHGFNIKLVTVVPRVTVLQNQHHQNFSTTSCCFEDEELQEKKKKRQSRINPNYVAYLQIKNQRLRIRSIPVETSKLYMESEAYKLSYGDFRVWELHKRNFAKGKIHTDTRHKCIRHHKVQTGNACPLCRDMYLILHPENIKLLNQFINEHSGDIIPTKITNVCQMKHKELTIAVEKARDLGLLTIDQKFVEYDYSKYNR